MCNSNGNVRKTACTYTGFHFLLFLVCAYEYEEIVIWHISNDYGKSCVIDVFPKQVCGYATQFETRKITASKRMRAEKGNVLDFNF